MPISRTLLNFWLDVTLLVTFLAGLWTVFVIRLAFPPGTRADGWLLWGLSFDQWFEAQFWLWCGFAFSVLLHVMLHWSWVCGFVVSRLVRDTAGKKRQLGDGERTLFGVGLLMVILSILGTGLAFAMFSVQSPGT